MRVLNTGKILPETKESLPVFTIGHSTRSLEEFVNILEKCNVRKIVDIRTVPRSRHNPQFNRETLPANLAISGIGYVHVPGLGGLRHTRVDSLNRGWRNASFRGFADYMQTQEFEDNLTTLIQLSEEEQIAIMCAESLPWRCHRSLIADALLVRGIEVKHIMNAAKSREHTLTPWIKVVGTDITYPPPA